MSLLWEALGVAVAIYFIYVLIQHWDRAIGTTARPDLKGPRGWPLIGHLDEGIKYEARMMEWSVRMHRRWGVGWSITLPGIRMVDVSRPDWIQYVQKDNFENYVKGSIFEDLMGDVFGGGIFVVDGSRWHVQRKTTASIFSGRSFKGIITPAIHDSVSLLRQIVAKHAANGDAFDLAAVFFNLTLESFVKMAFGQSVGALRLDSDEPVPFAVAFDYAQGRMNSRFQVPVGWSIIETLTGNRGKMRSARKFLDDYAYSLIDARTTSTDPEKDVEKATGVQRLHKDLLGLYMDARDEQGKAMTREQLRDAVLNLIIAGRDTTAQALSWTFFRLISTGEHWQPMREEIGRVLGEDGTVNYDNYRSLIYVTAVLNEALRLHPSVPKNAKLAVKDDQIPNGGPRVEAGDLIRWSDWAIARDPDVWGPDCCEFKPSRWIDENGRLQQFGQWKFHVFNGGPRLCLGMSLATFEAVAVIVELVRNFDLDFAPGWWESVPKTHGICEGEDSPLYASSLTHPMKAPFMVTARKRAV